MVTKYGDTFSNIRSGERIINLQFKTDMLSPRNLAEVSTRLAEWSQVSDTQPVCFAAGISGREVAGYWCSPSLFFVYPVENGTPVINEAEATFYAGEYEFQDGDAKAIFDDLKQKLTQLYGEPHTAGNSLDGVFGEASIPEDRQQEYDEMVKSYDTSYVVWVSSANNAVLVLKLYNDYGFKRTKLDYISLDAVEIFAQIEVDNADSASDSLEGL